MADDDVQLAKIPIPTPSEIVKDTLKTLIIDHGWDFVQGVWGKLKPDKKKALPSGGGGGGALLLLALAATQGKKRKGRRRRRR